MLIVFGFNLSNSRRCELLLLIFFLLLLLLLFLSCCLAVRFLEGGRRGRETITPSVSCFASSFLQGQLSVGVVAVAIVVVVVVPRTSKSRVAKLITAGCGLTAVSINACTGLLSSHQLQDAIVARRQGAGEAWRGPGQCVWLAGEVLGTDTSTAT